MRALLIFLCAAGAFAQAPQIYNGGIVNAASYSGAIAPGSIASIFGSNLAPVQSKATGPSLPLSLAGTAVSVNGLAAPLYYVSPGQIDFQTPAALLVNAVFTSYSQVTVVVNTPAGSSAPAFVNAFLSVPGFFTGDSSGCGQAAAFNVAPDGIRSLNSPVNSAAPGDFLEIYGTGFGTAYFQPPDGEPATAAPLSFRPSLFFDAISLTSIPANGVASPSYSGLAPGLAGVDQLDVQIPQGTREGCAVPITAVSLGPVSQTATVSIHSGRGSCVDPPSQSLGTILLSRTSTSGTPGQAEGVTDDFTASFQSGPGIQPPPPPALGSYIVNDYTVTQAIDSTACSVAGYSQLSAGTIRIQSPTVQQPIVIQPPDYRQTLPLGFIHPGQYTISASGAGTVGPFQTTVAVGSPIQIQTPLSALGVTRPFTISWTGGDPGTLVKVSLFSGLGLSEQFDYGYVPASAGSFTFNPICSGHSVSSGGNGVVCSFGIPLSPGARIVVEVSRPSPSNLSGNLQVSWLYRYVFTGLTLSQ